MPRVLIVGDSTLDNGPYVGAGGRPFYDHLEEALKGAFAVEFRALDGALVRDVIDRQLPRPGAGEAYEAVVVSVGGNDALGHADLLSSDERRTLMETALLLGGIQEAFRQDYRQMLARARPLAPRLIALVVYRGCFSLDPAATPDWQAATSTLLSIFTDVMAEEARAVDADVLDLRTLFTDPGLYANPIEPNDPGGALVARTLAGWLLAPGQGG